MARTCLSLLWTPVIWVHRLFQHGPACDLYLSPVPAFRSLLAIVKMESHRKLIRVVGLIQGGRADRKLGAAMLFGGEEKSLCAEITLGLLLLPCILISLPSYWAFHVKVTTMDADTQRLA